MAVNTFITLIVAGLLIYGFRLLCRLLLKNTTGRNYSGQIASANQLMFVRAKALLDRDVAVLAPEQLDKLEASLDRDYRVVTYLLEHAAEVLDVRPQRFMLTADFHLMRVWYRVIRSVSRTMAKMVVLEMALIVAHLAHEAGERLVARRA